MKLAFYSTKPYDIEYFTRYNRELNYELLFFETKLEAKSAALSEGCQAVCAFVNDELDDATLSQLSKRGIGLVVLRSAGYNNIDLAAAKKYQIKVARVPAYSPHAVAEHALALILTLNRKTHKAYNRVRENNFSLDKLLGFDIFGKTIGVVGTGKIGEVFAKILLGLGAKVLAYDVFKNKGLESQGVTYVPFEKLLVDSKIISLHCPLTPETKHLFNAKVFSQMQSGAMLINTSRGGLIETQDAIAALKSGRLGYLGIDVYEQEGNLFFNDLSESILQDDTIARLMTFPNVLVTSHQGFFTEEALSVIAQTTLKNVQDYFSKVPLVNEVI